jgi:hypothetical protein
MRNHGAGLGLALLLGLPACQPRMPGGASEPRALGVRTDTRGFAAATNRDVDVLFAIDGAPAMAKPLANLRAAFPAFLKTLAALPGGLPNIHLAVVSSDLGAGMGLDPQCVGHGDRGLLQPTTDHDCDPTLQDALPDGGRFIAAVDGKMNTAAPVDRVFGCLATMSSGCAFGQPLLSLVHALGADNFDPGGQAHPPPENAGFLRDGARLAVIVVSNQDDCSAVYGSASPLFADKDARLGSELGPAQRYRCNEFGHLCGDRPAPPPRLAPGGDVNARVTLDDCVPADDQGKLIPVADFAAVIKALKPDPENEILFAAVTGPTSPYTVSWRAAPVSDSGPWPEVEHACIGDDGSFADPSVRLTSLVDHFGRNGVTRSLCDGDLTPALTDIAGQIGRTIGLMRCVTALFADRDANPDNGVQFDCVATDHFQDESGDVRDVELPACEQISDGRRCWRLADGAACVPAPSDVPGSIAKRFVVENATPPGLQSTTLSCKVCVPGATDPRCPGP